MAFLDVNEQIKPRLPIPKFSMNPALTFTSSSDGTFKEAKKLLYAAKASYVKVSSKKKKEKLLSKDKFSLDEKLVEIYIQFAKKKQARNGCFIKCNYLEELVLQEDLSYFIMKMYPSKIFLYYKNPNRVNFFYHANIAEEYDFFESIDNEEIPTCIFDQIMSCENWFLMYDYHCFLQIQKYAFEDESAQPVFSGFVLLKPTTKLLIDLVNKSTYDTNNNAGSSHETESDLIKKAMKLRDNYEAKIYLELSGPLYLDGGLTALELINFLKHYQSPFGYTSLKVALAKRPVSVNMQPFNPFKEELLKILEENIPPQPSSSSVCDSEMQTEDGDTSKGFSHVKMKEDLQAYIANRILEIDYYGLHTTQTTTLVEVFGLMAPRKNVTPNDCNQYTDYDKYYLSVFWRYGQFYTCLSLEKYAYNPDDRNTDFLVCMGSKEDLDRYIFKVAEILSCKFTKVVDIKRKNMLDNTTSCFLFPSHKPRRFPKWDESPFRTQRIPVTEENDDDGLRKYVNLDKVSSNEREETNLDYLGAWDEALESLVRQGLINQSDYKVKDKATNLQKSLSNLGVSSNEREETNLDYIECKFFDSYSIMPETQELPEIHSNFTSSAYDHLFGKEKNTDCNSPLEIVFDLMNYPKLKKFKFSKEDYMRGIHHDHTEDMRECTKRIAEI